MDKHNEFASGDISPSAAMLRMISGFRVSWAIYIVAKLGLADLLKEGSKSTEELAEATGTHASLETYIVGDKLRVRYRVNTG